MKVKELIDVLSKMDADEAEIYIHDADTGWFLPVHIGTHPYEYPWTETPKNSISIYGDYTEHIKSNKEKYP